MDLNTLERPQRRATLGGRLAGYALATVVICVLAAIVGEVFFPAELEGDTGENDFAGLAAIVWALGAFVLCVAAAAVSEAYLRAVRSKSDAGGE